MFGGEIMDTSQVRLKSKIGKYIKKKNKENKEA